MRTLSEAVRETLANEYRTRAAELHKWADPLSDDQFWRNSYSYGTSPGHLVLHLTGSISYFIGSHIAESGYVRNRDLEFTESRKAPKSEVLQKFDQTIAMVIATTRKAIRIRLDSSFFRRRRLPKPPERFCAPR
jgi:hypothetical protein